jgi:nicotinate-nucleotide pyrophosphorylase (carboxylating)
VSIEEIIIRALEEDIGKGDITTEWLIPENKRGKGFFVAKENGILAGIGVAEMVFQKLDKELVFTSFIRDGEPFTGGSKIAKLEGRIVPILMGERTALNFLCHLSGIATLTNEFVKRIEGTNVRILDTRKTTPLLREIEKYAVRCGGGENHRLGLYDKILVKDNHLKVIRRQGDKETNSMQNAKCKMKKVGATSWLRPNNKETSKLGDIEVEVKNLKEVENLLTLNIKRIMLDNMDIKNMKKAVKMIRVRRPDIEIEASGGVGMQNVREMAETGVDYISIGALTHSAKWVDISFDLL